MVLMPVEVLRVWVAVGAGFSDDAARKGTFASTVCQLVDDREHDAV
jgi:hypothetical protein